MTNEILVRLPCIDEVDRFPGVRRIPAKRPLQMIAMDWEHTLVISALKRGPVSSTCVRRNRDRGGPCSPS